RRCAPGTELVAPSGEALPDPCGVGRSLAGCQFGTLAAPLARQPGEQNIAVDLIRETRDRP
ncbi:MAG: hypothetical protein L0312_17935, partial [Acidobacteria bacterium]|nr:hypothetical protein [Acidobacteriota bacterium]